jgi:hypothetical protein
MNKQNLFDKKRQSKQQQNVDDEQIEKTLNYFDSILNQYLTDQDTIDENRIQNKSTNGTSIQQNVSFNFLIILRKINIIDYSIYIFFFFIISLYSCTSNSSSF